MLLPGSMPCSARQSACPELGFDHRQEGGQASVLNCVNVGNNVSALSLLAQKNGGFPDFVSLQAANCVGLAVHHKGSKVHNLFCKQKVLAVATEWEKDQSPHGLPKMLWSRIGWSYGRYHE